MEFILYSQHVVFHPSIHSLNFSFKLEIPRLSLIALFSCLSPSCYSENWPHVSQLDSTANSGIFQVSRSLQGRAINLLNFNTITFCMLLLINHLVVPQMRLNFSLHQLQHNKICHNRGIWRYWLVVLFCLLFFSFSCLLLWVASCPFPVIWFLSTPFLVPLKMERQNS